MFEVKNGSIDFENVTFAYSQKSDKRVLKDINLHIESGETVGIIGATGSGKTSLVSLIPRLYDVTEGSVKVGGTDVRDYDTDTLRNKVAMVLQKNVLFSGSVAENLRWGDEYASDARRQDRLARKNLLTLCPAGSITIWDRAESTCRVDRSKGCA